MPARHHLTYPPLCHDLLPPSFAASLLCSVLCSLSPHRPHFPPHTHVFQEGEEENTSFFFFCCCQPYCDGTRASSTSGPPGVSPKFARSSASAAQRTAFAARLHTTGPCPKPSACSSTTPSSVGSRSGAIHLRVVQDPRSSSSWNSFRTRQKQKKASRGSRQRARRRSAAATSVARGRFIHRFAAHLTLSTTSQPQ